MRPLLAAAATAALVAIAGCSSPSQGTLTPTASPASTVRAVAPPTTVKSRTLTRAAAAKRYLEIVRPYNVALERLEQAFNAGAPLVRLRALADGSHARTRPTCASFVRRCGLRRCARR